MSITRKKIEVLPVVQGPSPPASVARAGFGDARLSTYSINAVPPIHIIVKNGHVDLEGVVRTQTDKDTAFIPANGVAGVFPWTTICRLNNRDKAKAIRNELTGKK